MCSAGQRGVTKIIMNELSMNHKAKGFCADLADCKDNCMDTAGKGDLEKRSTAAFRASDIDDIILNTLGVLIGYGIYLAVKHIKR